MPTIKHVGNHTDQLHDGRPMAPEATRTITDDELALDHYQARLTAGTLITVDDPEPADNQPKPKPATKPAKPTTTEDQS